MEILISIFILSVGLLGVASLIPLGTIALRETEKSDRTGACGRAALREVKVRKMLDYRNWWAPPPPGAAVPAAAKPGIIAIDPLGYASNLPATLAGATGGIPRFTFWENVGGVPQAMTFNTAEPTFFWQDEVKFDMPKDRTTVPANAGDRPMVITDTGLITGIPLRDGNFTWFLTVAPSPTDANTPISDRRSYMVSVVVCNARKLGADGERLVPTTGTVTCTSPSYGGTAVSYSGDIVSGNPLLRNDEWVLLYSMGPEPFLDLNGDGDYADAGESYADANCSGAYDMAAATGGWYRVVHAAYDANSNTSHVNLVGPDWNGGTAANIVVIGGVTGVYTTTVELDSNNLIWTR